MKMIKQPLIDFQNIRKVYKTGDSEYEALHDVTVRIDKEEFVAIMGPSGSGKSTTMHIMGALDTPTSGKYFLNGMDISNYTDDQLAHIRNQEIGFVFQSFNLLSRTSVIKNVERPMSFSNTFPPEKRRARALEMLKLVHLEDKAENLSNQISGGQIQRVAIARALVMNPSLLLADEPTGNLDSKTSHEIMSFFQTLHKQGHTIVVITHEPDIAAYSDRIIQVRDGSIISDKKNNQKVKGGSV
ncbi:MAG TPA: ABC transporter ATP-binding protein [Patescibacteria group bacterium]|nr:ABC transporter ATP-binding protein [Patescibacteria group bacterium]